MRRTLLWSVVAMLSLMVAVQAQDKMGGGTEKAVAALEQQWLESQKTNNPDLVAPLLADKFTNTGPDGKVSGKAAMLGALSFEDSRRDGRSTKHRYFQILVIDAVILGRFRCRSGKPMDLRERFTDTWVEMPSGKWQCVASHGSPIKM